MKTHKHLWETVASPENLLAAATEAMRGKGTHAGVRRAAEFARRFPVGLKCDLRRYFPSIDHDILMGRLQRVVADRSVLGLIEKILGSHREGSRKKYGDSPGQQRGVPSRQAPENKPVHTARSAGGGINPPSAVPSRGPVSHPGRKLRLPAK